MKPSTRFQVMDLAETLAGKAPIAPTNARAARIEHRGSCASNALEIVWRRLISLVPTLPPAVIVLLDARARRYRLGHFARSCWTFREDRAAHEIGLSPDLFESAEAVLAVLLHEAAHALHFERTGSGGCGSGGYYHLASYRDVAVELGLQCQFLNTRYGWTVTDWPATGVPGRYAPVVELLRANLPPGTTPQANPQGKSPAARQLPTRGQVRMMCGCARVIYASKSIAAAGDIVCRLCGRDFTNPMKPEALITGFATTAN